MNRRGKMNFFRILVVLMMLGFTIATTGCGGGGAEIKATNTTTTMGQELHDIKKAFDQGIITEKEYERAKKDILKKYD